MGKVNMPGIIPVAGMTSEFGTEWDASLVPVAPNYTAIEAAIYECLHVGCTSIWIIANDDVAPLIRHRIGSWTTDAYSMVRAKFTMYPSDHHQEVPIYYAPIHPRHRKRVDNYAWSSLWGCNVAYWVMKRFSRWAKPTQYYISFPLGVIDAHEIREYRSTMRTNAPFYFSHNGKTVKDGLPISFTIDPEEWRRAKHIITRNASMWVSTNSQGPPTEKLPIEERYISRKYGLKEVFGGSERGIEQELKCFYDLTTWGGYVTLLSSELGGRMKRPTTKIMYRGRKR